MNLADMAEDTCRACCRHERHCECEKGFRSSNPDIILDELAAKLGCEPRQVADRVIRMLEERAK